ncbi:hypothetical protein [Nocardia cyriacigeorgica]|uniref:hypothetical protein n=1 Tax=Nocardia cyriacigeorgica TaxID=135487 RepID=UPI001895A5F9|nr:hypothetical protein [Nocardia cyriacigeorgica]MBF6289320.1 hypothetical protein [Nocardia cyriacigeorgica]
MEPVRVTVPAQTEFRRVRRIDRARARIHQSGKLVELLRLLADRADEVEADLARHFGIRYTDRWRFDEQGQRRLTLREIWVRLRQLPDDSAIVIANNGGRRRWSDAEFLLADVFHALNGRMHPMRPKPKAATSKQEPSRRAALRKRRIRQERERMERQRGKGVVVD